MPSNGNKCQHLPHHLKDSMCFIQNGYLLQNQHIISKIRKSYGIYVIKSQSLSSSHLSFPILSTGLFSIFVCLFLLCNKSSYYFFQSPVSETIFFFVCFIFFKGMFPDFLWPFHILFLQAKKFLFPFLSFFLSLTPNEPAKISCIL